MACAPHVQTKWTPLFVSSPLDCSLRLSFCHGASAFPFASRSVSSSTSCRSSPPVFAAASRLNQIAPPSFYRFESCWYQYRVSSSQFDRIFSWFWMQSSISHSIWWQELDWNINLDFHLNLNMNWTFDSRFDTGCHFLHVKLWFCQIKTQRMIYYVVMIIHIGSGVHMYLSLYWIIKLETLTIFIA